MKFLSLSLLLLSLLSSAQKSTNSPKVVVGIVVDQMRQDYLYRFYDRYSESGFKRILKNGYQFKNAHYNYIPTYTAPGHAAIYTGTTPAYNGIIANEWFSREKGLKVYCVSDTDVTAVGGSERNGKMSPKNLKASTVTDELILSSNFQSKVVGISIKDRGAILPAGHNPTGAYWFDSNTGNFMSSSYYFDDLPKWVQNFNKKRNTSLYLDQKWVTLYPIESYDKSSEDSVPYERAFKGSSSPSFPYDLKKLTEDNGIGLIRTTPYGNSLVLDMALAAIEGESLGDDQNVDFLSISFSSTDYVGHAFGPNSIELEDTYLRLDQEIERLLTYLDEKFTDEYIIFITADHGVANIPLYMQEMNLVGGYIDSKATSEILMKKIEARLGDGEWIINFSNDQIFINQELVKEKGLELNKIQNIIKEIVLETPEVSEVYTAHELSKRNGTGFSRILLENGFNTKMSGDLLIRLNPGYIDEGYGKKGTTHGSGYNYDTNIPILFYGMNIPSGSSVRRVSITDIAPSISMLLNISLPNAATGTPLAELFK